jgi:hypothetical protein
MRLGKEAGERVLEMMGRAEDMGGPKNADEPFCIFECWKFLGRYLRKEETYSYNRLASSAWSTYII